MRLVDILARELKVWPEGCSHIVQDHDGQCWPSAGDISASKIVYGKEWSTDDDGVLEFYSEIASDFGSAKVTRAEWQAAVDALDQSELDAVLAKNEQLAAARAERIPVWNGEGLPPVGLDVEIKRGNCTWIDGDEWQIGKTATVMASFLNSRDIEMASVQFPGGHCECILARCLSPIRTAEQVAAEEREKAIEDMLSLFEVAACKQTYDMLGGIAAIYDANYRKQVAK